MTSGRVIQGYFPYGLSRITAAQPIQPMRAVPEWVQRTIGMAPAQRAVQRHEAGAGTHRDVVTLPPNLSRFGAGRGEPLGNDVRATMESCFQTSFADVRIHVGPAAASLGALAFAHGSDIHFSPGQYTPATPRGLHVLGHELAHVVQQRAGRVRNPFSSGIAVVHDATLEAEAERMGQRAASAWRVPLLRPIQPFRARPGTIQRADKDEKSPARVTRSSTAMETKDFTWMNAYNGQYLVIAMIKDLEKLSRMKAGQTLDWKNIDHAVLCFGKKCYGWGVVCSVWQDTEKRYVFDHTTGERFYGIADQTGTLETETFKRRTKEWIKLNAASSSTQYPNNCRGYVDYVIERGDFAA